MSTTMKYFITVFGGSQCGPDDAEYRDALRLGRLLAERGFTVVCGGYSGVMEAVSRGAREAGGEAIGVTLADRQARPNEYLTRQQPAPDLFERLRGLILQSSGFVALRGGLGTIVEVCLVWNLFLLRTLTPRPLVLLGDCWPPVVEAWRQHLPVEETHQQWIQFASVPDEAGSRLTAVMP